MTKKNTDKLTISLKKDDEANLLKIRQFVEGKSGINCSMADVVRFCINEQMKKLG